ncbi:glycosyltransferase [Candidatus Gracilibacteria bacterium]|nr:glycosyltransferase [Candidatus Gracilibacteria bacterium]
MKIVFLADPIDNQNAGIHVYTKSLAEEFLHSDNEIIFIHERENNFFDKTNHHIIPKKRKPFYNTYRKFHLIPKLITELNPDIVFEPCHIGPFRLPAHIKRVTTIHDITPILFPETHTIRGAFIHKLLLKKAIRETDLIITPSEHTKNDIIKYRPHKNIKSIPLAAPNPTPKKVQNFHPFLLYIGTIEPRKNLTTSSTPLPNSASQTTN